MRFKKWSKVEVLSKKEVPSGSWRCAEIICGNGHNYTVRYDGNEGANGEAIAESVSRNAIRPCPPPLEISENWVRGDVVEVFDNFSWKMATVSQVLGKKYFLVRLLGSSLEFKVFKFNIRPRQSWHDDKWVVVGKVISHGSILICNFFFKMPSSICAKLLGVFQVSSCVSFSFNGICVFTLLAPTYIYQK